MEQTDSLIPPAEWDTLTVNQLIDQKSILFEKWMYLVEKQYPYAKDLKEALDKIDAMIVKKSIIS